MAHEILSPSVRIYFYHCLSDFSFLYRYLFRLCDIIPCRVLSLYPIAIENTFFPFFALSELFIRAISMSEGN